MGSYGYQSFGYYYNPKAPHTWPGKVKPSRAKGCGKHRKGQQHG